jgi:hypothetical protein
MCTSRRHFLNSLTNGFAGIALPGLFAEQARADARAKNRRGLNHEPKAKAIIYMYMEGGPSQIDTFDPKPRLTQDHGKELPFETPATEFNIGKKILASPFAFSQHGQCGAWVSDLFPNVAKHVDDLCIIRSMHHEHSNHTAAAYFSHTGHNIPGRPSMGSWFMYGLGSECKNLPGFVVLDSGMGPSGGSANWSSGFLPASYQGTVFSRNEVPVDYLKPIDRDRNRQRKKLDVIRAFNQKRSEALGDDSRIDALIANYELAYQMQTSVPNVADLSGESEATLKQYGVDNPETEIFGSRLLIARRLVERGVRFIEVFPPNLNIDRWDQHEQIEKRHRMNAQAVDKPIAGLIADLKARGMLEETILMWGGEFGRTPSAQGTGRDHNPFGYTVWTAGGGFRSGIQYGNTDEFGYFAIENKVHGHDLHATILHLMGIDHEKLTYNYAGRDFRLTDVHGRVVKDLLV